MPIKFHHVALGVLAVVMLFAFRFYFEPLSGSYNYTQSSAVWKKENTTHELSLDAEQSNLTSDSTSRDGGWNDPTIQSTNQTTAKSQEDATIVSSFSSTTSNGTGPLRDNDDTTLPSALLKSHHMNNNDTQRQARNYFDLFQGGYFPRAAASSSLRPLEILQDHVRAFSQQALEQTWRDCGNEPCDKFDRFQFVVGRYSCPLEAGNRLIKMVNGLLWAVVTGRAFLWGYWDREACLLEDNGDGELPSGFCDWKGTLNTPEDCAEILKISNWVPSWDEWSVKLNLSQPVRACVVGARNLDRFAIPMDGPNMPRVIRVGAQINLEPAIRMGRQARRLIGTAQARNNARGIVSYGVYFCYGMLFESLFTLHSSLLPDPDLLYDNAAVDTYLLHARHKLDRDDGSNIQMELSCMEKVISNRTDATRMISRQSEGARPCVVYCMTDRTKTKLQLPAALAKFNCTAIFTSNTTRGTSFNSEHGPYAGRGFFQDLALVRNARRGVMSPNKRNRPRVGIRTSTALAKSLIDFRRILESPNGNLPDFKECYTY